MQKVPIISYSFMMAFLGCSSVLVDSLFIVAPIVCESFKFVSFLVLRSSCRGRESWLLNFNCLLDVMWLLLFCVSSSWCHGLVCHCGI